MTSFSFFLLLGALLLILRLEQKLLKAPGPLVLWQKGTLLAGSLVFAALADPRFALILLLQAAAAWYCGRDPRRVPWGVGLLVLCLGFFKYTDFFYQSFAALLGREQQVLLKIILPLGISFYTFSAISYLVDVKRGRLGARGFLDVALYLSFFPKLTSGPIQRSGDFFTQADAPRQIRWEGLSAGLQIFVLGMFKKLVLADNLSVFVNAVFRRPAAFDALTVLLAVLSYAMQIYYDFSGYSDMAIGAARMLDIRLPANFDLPYLSHNVTELWKRWHITLSSWLQDYLYFPLGGSRRGTLRTCCNLILTMVLGGLWHGASLTYILWGLLHGLGLAVHKLWVKFTDSPHKAHSLWANILAVLTTFLFTSFCWVFFRAESVSQALAVLRQLLTLGGGIRHLSLWTFVCGGVLVITSLTAARRSRGRTPAKANQSPVTGSYPLVDLSTFRGQVLFFTFCGLLLCLAYTGGSPFIYGAY